MTNSWFVYLQTPYESALPPVLGCGSYGLARTAPFDGELTCLYQSDDLAKARSIHVEAARHLPDAERTPSLIDITRMPLWEVVETGELWTEGELAVRGARGLDVRIIDRRKRHVLADARNSGWTPPRGGLWTRPLIEALPWAAWVTSGRIHWGRTWQAWTSLDAPDPQILGTSRTPNAARDLWLAAGQARGWDKVVLNPLSPNVYIGPDGKGSYSVAAAAAAFGVAAHHVLTHFKRLTLDGEIAPPIGARPRSRVVCAETGEEWPSIAKAAEAEGMSVQRMTTLTRHYPERASPAGRHYRRYSSRLTSVRSLTTGQVWANERFASRDLGVGVRELRNAIAVRRALKGHTLTWE